MDVRREDKISSIILAVIAFLSFFIANLTVLRQTASDICSLIPVPIEYQPYVFLIGLVVVAIVGYWNYITPAKREEEAYNKGLLEVPVDTPTESVCSGDCEE